MSKKQSEVIVYTSTHCPYCVRAKSLLKRKEVEFTEVNVETEEGRRAEMIEKCSGLTSVPQIFINEQHIGGCDDLYALETQQKLDALLFVAD